MSNKLDVRFTGPALAFVIGFIRVGEGITMILSLGFLRPWWETKFLVWNIPALYKMQKEKKELK